VFNATFNNISVISWRFLYRNVGHFRKFIYAIFDSYLSQTIHNGLGLTVIAYVFFKCSTIAKSISFNKSDHTTW